MSAFNFFCKISLPPFQNCFFMLQYRKKLCEKGKCNTKNHLKKQNEKAYIDFR
jgi:hypothetical protein